MAFEYTDGHTGRKRKRHASGRARNRNGSSVVPVPRDTTTVVAPCWITPSSNTHRLCESRRLPCRVGMQIWPPCRCPKAPASMCPGDSRGDVGKVCEQDPKRAGSVNNVSAGFPPSPSQVSASEPATSMATPACVMSRSSAGARRRPDASRRSPPAGRRDRWSRPPRGFRLRRTSPVAAAAVPARSAPAARPRVADDVAGDRDQVRTGSHAKVDRLAQRPHVERGRADVEVGQVQDAQPVQRGRERDDRHLQGSRRSHCDSNSPHAPSPTAAAAAAGESREPYSPRTLSSSSRNRRRAAVMRSFSTAVRSASLECPFPEAGTASSRSYR